MGPSWYWMPDIFEYFFQRFEKKVSDYYTLLRLNPSYRVIFGENDIVDVPSDYEDYKSMLESMETGAGKQLDEFLASAEYNYKMGTEKFMRISGLSLSELVSSDAISVLKRINLFGNLSQQIRSHFKNEKIIKLMEFPAIFLGSTANNISSAYCLMNYVDIKLGTWYPMGGMYELVKAMTSLVEEKNVSVRCSSEVRSIEVENFQAKRLVLTSGEVIEADYVVASADYHHVDRELLDPYYSNYTEEYWDNRQMAPSALIFYLGVGKRLKNLQHHNLFFDESLEVHSATIFDKRHQGWPQKPLFYVSAPSITDPSVAPPGMENLFILVPLASNSPGRSLDTSRQRDIYYDIVMTRLEKVTGQDIRSFVVYKRSYAHRDFSSDYHAYKGNAYGLSNVLSQSAIFKPKIRNNVVNNLFYTGQLTVPGPGVPTCVLSGEIVANELINSLSRKNQSSQ